ncbi:hypothetical protein ACH5RR_012770 [Cinchona calisaya]|uniref:Uncharacterized protein n=1 Tax=Cinchona calisaya TaxID=153742 RepID=A0ABD3A8S8_9GENT
MSLHEINKMLQQLGHKSHEAMIYYYILGFSDLNNGLQDLQTDKHIREFCNWVIDYKLMEIYCDQMPATEIEEFLRSKVVYNIVEKKSGLVLEEIEDDPKVVPINTKLCAANKMKKRSKICPLPWTYEIPQDGQLEVEVHADGVEAKGTTEASQTNVMHKGEHSKGINEGLLQAKYVHENIIGQTSEVGNSETGEDGDGDSLYFNYSEIFMDEEMLSQTIESQVLNEQPTNEHSTPQQPTNEDPIIDQPTN